MRLRREALQGNVDTLIIIPNQNLFRIATEKTTFAEAFGMADQVLHSGVRGITDLMVMPGLINLDFADVRAVMSEMGKAMMGTGEASGEKRAIEAAHAAIANPLLDDVSMKGATGVLINITGGYDMTLYEVDEAANEIRSEVDPEANIIVGSTFDENMEGMMRVSVVATGIDAEAEAQDPRQIRRPIQTEARAPVRQPVREPLVRRAHDDRPAAPIQQPEHPAEHIVTPEAISEPIEAQREPIEAEAEIEDAHDPFVADERPQVIRDQERIAAEARTFTPAPPRAREPEPETQPEEKGGFSLFGRRKRPMAPVPKTAPTRAEDVTHRPASGDLFGESGDEGDLEIPAFLRRQAN